MTDDEVNTAVARKLGNPTQNIESHQMTHGHRTALGLHHCIDGCGKDFPWPYHLPDYCHSIAAAWEILTDRCDTWEIFCNGSTVDVTLSKSHNMASHEADTAPMAIALCFLKLL